MSGTNTHRPGERRSSRASARKASAIAASHPTDPCAMPSAASGDCVRGRAAASRCARSDAAMIPERAASGTACGARMRVRSRQAASASAAAPTAGMTIRCTDIRPSSDSGFEL